MTEAKRFCQDESAWQIMIRGQEGDECIVGAAVLG